MTEIESALEGLRRATLACKGYDEARAHIIQMFEARGAELERWTTIIAPKMEQMSRDIAAAEAEVQRLRTIIQQHNDGQVSSCEWRRNTPGSYADYCAAYTGRDRICPDCPRDNMIDAALRPSSEGGGG